METSVTGNAIESLRAKVSVRPAGEKTRRRNAESSVTRHVGVRGLQGANIFGVVARAAKLDQPRFESIRDWPGAVRYGIRALIKRYQRFGARAARRSAQALKRREHSDVVALQQLKRLRCNSIQIDRARMVARDFRVICERTHGA